MNCDEYKILISKSIDKSLTEDLNEHLLSCKDCKEYFDFSNRFQEDINESINRDFILPHSFSEVVLKRTGKRSSIKKIILIVAVFALVFLSVGISDYVKNQKIQSPGPVVTSENI